jgi:hypothetical protein
MTKLSRYAAIGRPSPIPVQHELRPRRSGGGDVRISQLVEPSDPLSPSSAVSIVATAIPNGAGLEARVPRQLDLTTIHAQRAGSANLPQRVPPNRAEIASGGGSPSDRIELIQAGRIAARAAVVSRSRPSANGGRTVAISFDGTVRHGRKFNEVMNLHLADL